MRRASVQAIDRVDRASHLDQKNASVSNSVKNVPLPGVAIPTPTTPLDNTKEVRECFVCLEEERIMHVQPCGHYVACRTCAMKIGGDECILCHKKITGYWLGEVCIRSINSSLLPLVQTDFEPVERDGWDVAQRNYLMTHRAYYGGYELDEDLQGEHEVSVIPWVYIPCAVGYAVFKLIAYLFFMIFCWCSMIFVLYQIAVVMVPSYGDSIMACLRNGASIVLENLPSQWCVSAFGVVLCKQ